MLKRFPALSTNAARRWRGFFAVFAVLVNAALPVGWEIALANTSPYGDTYSICLAGGGVIHDAPRPDGLPPSPSGSLHCHLCLLPGPPPVAQIAFVPPAPALTYARIRYERGGTTHVSSGAAQAFRARAPPS